jgi:hypothetical protein
MPSSFIYPCILLCCVCDDTCAVVGCRRQVPKRGSRGRVALGRRAVPLPPAPLHPADLRHRAVLEHLLLLPAVRRRPPSRPQCRLLRCRQLLPPSGRACLRWVRLWRPPRPRSLALRRSIRTFLFCNGSVTWRARSLLGHLGRNRAPAGHPVGAAEEEVRATRDCLCLW